MRQDRNPPTALPQHEYIVFFDGDARSVYILLDLEDAGAAETKAENQETDINLLMSLS